jgi:hypothetical protein
MKGVVRLKCAVRPSNGVPRELYGCRSLEANLLIAEQNLSKCRTRLKELGADDDSVTALTDPSVSNSLILSGNEDNYLTALVVKVRAPSFFLAVVLLLRLRRNVMMCESCDGLLPYCCVRSLAGGAF